MKVKELIEALSKIDPEKEIFVVNGMSYPFYDYEGMKATCVFDEVTNSIKITHEC